MKDKKKAEKKEKQIETLELDDEQASQVKGGSTPQWYSAQVTNENVVSPRDLGSGQSTGTRKLPT